MTLLLASLLVVPSAAPAAIVQKWHTGATESYQVLSRLGDGNGDGKYDLLTSEASGTNARIAIRAGDTGILEAQTALAYKVGDIAPVDLDGDGIPEIIILDLNSGHYICFNWSTASSTLAVRWTSSVAFPGTVEKQFVDFDGNGHLYPVFMASGAGTFTVYDRNGVLVSQPTIPFAPTGHPSRIYAMDGNADGKAELVIDFQSALGVNNSDFSNLQLGFWVYQSSTAAGVEPGAADVHAFTLSPSFPNPAASSSSVEYSMATAGPASLRLYDVTGREVRKLVDGPVAAGQHAVSWDGRDAQGRPVPAGTYFYELKAGGQRATRRVVRIR